jgi:RNA polymerase sigma-70 factor (ECF subfamily)
VEDPDQRIASAVLDGNPQAFNQLVERYWARIFARVYQLLGNREDAEEITQDTFHRALESLADFRWEASFSTWLYQIASNLARNRYWYWKRRRRERSMSLDMPVHEDGGTLSEILPDDAADPGERVRWNEFHSSIERELERLPARHRNILEMRLLDDLSYEAISDRLDVPVGTVKSRIARARQCLGNALGLQERNKVQGFAMDLSRQRK